MKSILFSLLAVSVCSVSFGDDNLIYPAPVCFDGPQCLVRITPCASGSNEYFFYVTTKTSVECITYDGKKVPTSKSKTERMKVVNSDYYCQQERTAISTSMPECN